MNVAAVIFDFDGVIADTERLHLGAFREVFDTRGWALSEQDYFDRYLGCDDHGLVVAYARDAGLTLAPEDIQDLVDRKIHAFSRHLSSPAVLFPNAAAAIRALSARFAVGIASGALRGEIEAILSAAQLRDVFRVIVGADDVSAHKPAPAPYLAAAAGLGVEPGACVAIEDSEAGIQAARAAGMRVIGVRTTSPEHLLTDAHLIVGTLADVSPSLVESLT
jgi:beta-phosphoglucomutase